MAKKTGTVKKRVVKVGTEGKVFVHSTFNNVIITIANADGQVISWSSAGKMGFRGSKKNTPYAAQTAATDCAKVAYDLGLRKVKVYVKGPGAGRESAIRTVHGAGIEVTEIVDVTPLPHNGCARPTAAASNFRSDATGAVRRRPHWRGFGEWGSPFGRLPAGYSRPRRQADWPHSQPCRRNVGVTPKRRPALR